MKEEIKVGNEELNKSAEESGEKDYARLIAAQNESKRRLKIKSINNTLSEEDKKRSMFAIASGVCFAGLVVATHFSGIDVNQAIQTEIQALSSFGALKEYLEVFTPAMWGTLIVTAGSLSQYIKHKKKYQKTKQELVDMMENAPEHYQDIVENQARVK